MQKVVDFRPKVLHFFAKAHDFFFQLHHFYPASATSFVVQLARPILPFISGSILSATSRRKSGESPSPSDRKHHIAAALPRLKVSRHHVDTFPKKTPPSHMK